MGLLLGLLYVGDWLLVGLISLHMLVISIEGGLISLRLWVTGFSGVHLNSVTDLGDKSCQRKRFSSDL